MATKYLRKQVIRKCLYCNKEFTTSSHGIKTAKYCSQDCCKQNQKQGIHKNCKQCGKEFYVQKSWIDSHVYCSQECRSLGTKSGNYKLCMSCGKEYYVCKSELNRSNYCSVECQHKGIGIERRGKVFYHPPKNRIIKQCVVCQKEFEVQYSRRNRSKYCSKECMYKGLTNYNKKEPYRYGKEFRYLRKIILSYNNECNLCFKKEKPLSLHHIDYNKENNGINNLIPLCKSCHAQTNYQRKDCYNFFKVMEVI